ncbi:MAG: cytochrome c [Marmoricola sp.]
MGAAAVDFQVGTGRMPMVQPGTQALRKAHLHRRADRAVVGIRGLTRPGPAVPTTEQYSLPADLTEDERAKAISEGGEFFRTNCTACHNFAGTGGALPQGRFAPTLKKGVSKRHLYEAMLTGPQQMPVFTDEVMSSEDKAKVIATTSSTRPIQTPRTEPPTTAEFNLGGLGPVSKACSPGFHLESWSPSPAGLPPTPLASRRTKQS